MKMLVYIFTKNEVYIPFLFSTKHYIIKHYKILPVWYANVTGLILFLFFMVLEIRLRGPYTCKASAHLQNNKPTPHCGYNSYFIGYRNLYLFLDSERTLKSFNSDHNPTTYAFLQLCLGKHLYIAHASSISNHRLFEAAFMSSPYFGTI